MKKTIEISGMSCGHCVHAVRDALSGLASVQVEDVAIGKAVVLAEPSATDDEIRAAIAEEGFTVTSVHTE
ncbi:MAG: heavy-metal-associated domain-containing protein [Rhodothermales bacterium]